MSSFKLRAFTALYKVILGSVFFSKYIKHSLTISHVQNVQASHTCKACEGREKKTDCP